MRVLPADKTNIIHVLDNLRQGDQREIEAYLGSVDLRSLGADYARCAADAALFEVAGTDQGLPVAIYGLTVLSPTTALAHLLATDDFDRIGFSITRRLRRVILPALIKRGVRRIEARAFLENEKACRWIESFGAHPECTVPMGLRGELFVQYALYPLAAEGPYPATARRAVVQAAVF